MTHAYHSVSHLGPMSIDHLDIGPTPRRVLIRVAETNLSIMWRLRKSHLRAGDVLRARAYSPVISGKIAELRKLKGDMK